MGLDEIRKKRWFRAVTNTYVIVLTLFLIWMVFFDTNSLMIHLELRKEIDKLEKQQEFLTKEIEKDRKIIEKLSDPKELEKFARENYYLKKKNEEIFLIEYQDSIAKNKEKKYN